jgi:hypothetical protein
VDDIVFDTNAAWMMREVWPRAFFNTSASGKKLEIYPIVLKTSGTEINKAGDLAEKKTEFFNPMGLEPGGRSDRECLKPKEPR